MDLLTCIHASSPFHRQSSLLLPSHGKKIKWKGLEESPSKWFYFFTFFFFLQQTKLFCQEQWQIKQMTIWRFFTEVKYFFFSYLFSLTFGSCRSAMINILISNKSTEEKVFSSPQKPSTISLTLLLILLFYHSNKANLSRDLFQLKGKNVLKGKISIMQTLLDIFSVRSYYGKKIVVAEENFTVVS